MAIYEIIHNGESTECDKRPPLTREIRKLKRKGLIEGKDFFIRGKDAQPNTQKKDV